jgi:hypothetical protein
MRIVILSTLFFLSGFAGKADAERATPVSSGGAYTLTTGPLTLSVGTGNGGRVTSLKHSGKEMFFTQVAGSLLWGSTLWASPQVNWTAACKSAKNMNCFPPPPALDPNPYSATLLNADTAITFTGGADAYTQLRFRKTFSADLADTSFTALYHLINISNSPISWGPWETTRFPSGGLVFWPTGQGEKTGDAAMLQRMRDTLGVTWFPYDSSKAISSNPKTFADGGPGGWLARVDKDRVIFIKKFTDTPLAQRAPEGENEVELYIQRDLLELELQGPYGTIPANDSVGWEVKWYARKLPDEIPVTRNAALVAFVEKTVAERSVALRKNPIEGQRTINSSSQPEISLRRVANAWRVELKAPSSLQISLRDAQGKEMANLFGGSMPAGTHELRLPKYSLGKGAWIVVTDIPSGALLLRQPVTP